METINITWSVNGMDMVDTTHLIRHRLFSFAAQVHGDRDMRDDRVVVKPHEAEDLCVRNTWAL